MANLQQLLGYFERDDIEEVRLQSSAPVVLVQGGRSRPLTRQPITGAQVLAFVRGSPIESKIPDRDTAGSPQTLNLLGRDYLVAIAKHGDLIQIRIRKPAASSAATAAPATTTRPAATPKPQPAPAASPAAAPAPATRDKPAATAAPRARAKLSAAPGDLVGLLRQARDAQASDVHLMSERPCSVRVAGQLEPTGSAMSDRDVRRVLLELVPHHQREQLDELGYCDFAAEIQGAGRFRVNVSRQRTGLKGCFRLIADKPASLEDLNLPSELAKVTSYHQGLAIISGPSGQGKTTTMAALVDMLNASKPVHIITVEDPVEFLHPIKRAVLTQREVGAHTKSFHTALKAALREDPDVIVLGELRDRETVEMALSAAETGHLVIATMSTPSGAKTIDRLIDMFPPDDQAQVRATLAGALKIVVSQRLVPRADGQGQVAAAELITGNIPLWTLIRDNKLFQLPSLLQRGRAYGMIRIEDSLSTLLEAGTITEESAKLYADDPRSLKLPGAAAAAPTPAPKRGGLRNLFGKGGS